MRAIPTSLVRYTPVILVAGLALTLSQELGCSSSPSPSQPQPGTASDQKGSVGASLTLPGGEVLSSASWVITGPNGASTVVQQGTVNLQNSQQLSFTVGGILAGSGYSLSVTSTSVDGTVNCSGHASFAVTGGATTNVTVLMQCLANAPDAGSAAVNGQLYSCATASGVSVSPSETTIGNSVSLTATAVGPNPGALAYAWSAPSGTFSSSSSATTNFTCTSVGPVSLTITVSDGTVPDGGACSPALASASVTVQCDAPLDSGAPDATVPDSGGATACSLGAGGAIKHVIYVQFDNTHLSRDNQNVPSDLEQMPHLLSFIRSNGTMMANDHTVLISHTSDGILSSITGKYGDRNGQTVGNSYVRTSTTGAFSFPSSFQYWTDTVAAANTPTVFSLVQPDGTAVPAPWAAYTRAGCNFGAVALANMELENVSTGATGDMTTVFGANSPQWTEAKNNSTKAIADYEGIAVHCALGSPLCASGEADVLAQEPGGYNGFMGLFGAQQVDPILTGADAGTPLIDLLGNPIQDGAGNPGFPGFNGMYASVSLGYMAYMQEHGIPVTYAYISDAHDNHVTGNAFGPGQAGYVAQLASYDTAFANFFTRLAADGIDKTNTLFIFTVDEGDHFVGVTPSPANCDGVNVPCTYPPPAGQTSGLGEVDENIDTLMSSEQPAVASQFVMGNHANPGAPYDFTVHGDDAPTFYLSRVAGDAGPTGPLAQTDPVTRSFERAAAQLNVLNPYNGNTDPLLFKMADQTGMAAIHMMTTGDPVRNPTFVYFADDDYYIADFGLSCSGCIGPAFAWNHGDDQSVIGMTWQGYVGPGVKNQADQTVFTDHTDLRVTINSILGLRDPYQGDGRVITQALQPSGYSTSLASNLTTVETLGDNYKQINAPFGPFGQCVLTASTYALQADDATYASFESSIATLTSQRDTLATAIKTALDGAEFGGTPVDSGMAASWITQAQAILTSCNMLVASIPPPVDAGSSSDAASSSDASDASSSSSDASDAASSSSDASDAQSTDAGNAGAQLVIYRVGSGGDSGALSSAATPVFLDEYTFAGGLVTSIPMPTVASGSVHALVASGSATSEGLITRSVDGHYVLSTGYNAAVGTTGIAATASTAVARVIGRLDASGNVDTSTALTDTDSGNNPRSAVSTDGMNLWIAGAVDGVKYTTLGATTAVGLGGANLRQVNIFGGQLYVDDSSTTNAFRFGAVGSGLPTTAGQTITGIPGFSLSTGSPYGFFFTTLNGGASLDTLYVTDDGVGITKYSLVSGSWAASGTVGSGTDAYRSLVGVVNGTSVTLYATGNGIKLVTITDSSGYNGTFSGTPTLLASAATNEAFRGVALAPQ